MWSGAIVWLPIVLGTMGWAVWLRITDVTAYRKLRRIVLTITAITLVTVLTFAIAYLGVKVSSIWDSADGLLRSIPGDSLTYAKGDALNLRARAGEAQRGLEVIFLCYMIPLLIVVFFGLVEFLFERRGRDSAEGDPELTQN